MVDALLERVGLSKDTVQQGARALMYSARKGFSEDERARFATIIDAVYDDFVAKVAAARKHVRSRRSKLLPGVASGLVGTPSRRVWSMSWVAFVTQFASPGNGRTCRRMHLCWGQSAFRRWRGSAGRRTARIRGPGQPLHGPAFLTWPLHLGCLPTQRFGCLITLQ